MLFGVRKTLDADPCNVGDKFYPDNNQRSRRPPPITHDHGYCYGWAEMEDANY